MAEKHSGGVSFYIVIALILGAITYLEFAIVEYNIPWLSSTLVFVLLAGMSLVKFALVVAIYMHLRDDDRLYTGFFSSGMIIAISTFVALSFLFTVRSAGVEGAFVREVREEAAHGEGEEAVALIAERPAFERLRVPEPKRQSLVIPLPAAQGAEYSLVSSTSPSTPPLPEDDPDASEPLAQAEAEFAWQALGEETYSANCSACHQASGEGIPPAFPPLAGHLSELYNLEGGRDYLIHVLLYGLQGEIQVNGQSYNGVMPAWPQLSNEQIAAVLNHELTSWDNESLLQDFEPILPDEVAAERDLGLSALEVLQQRPQLP